MWLGGVYTCIVLVLLAVSIELLKWLHYLNYKTGPRSTVGNK